MRSQTASSYAVTTDDDCHTERARWRSMPGWCTCSASPFVKLPCCQMITPHMLAWQKQQNECIPQLQWNLVVGIQYNFVPVRSPFWPDRTIMTTYEENKLTSRDHQNAPSSPLPAEKGISVKHTTNNEPLPQAANIPSNWKCFLND